MQGCLTKGSSPFGGQSLGGALGEVTTQRRARGKKSGIENTTRLLTAADPIYTRNEFADVLENFQDGKLMQRYLWPRVRTYYESFYPAQWVKNNIIAPTHSFGLKYDPDAMATAAHKTGYYFKDADYYYTPDGEKDI